MVDNHDELHLALHREADKLGKFAIHMHIHAPQSLSQEDVAHFLDELLTQVTQSCMDHGADLVGM